MHYVYVLDGQLKYESISFDSILTFILLKDNKKAEDLKDKLAYYLKSEVDLTITLDSGSGKLSFSSPTEINIQLFNQAGDITDTSSNKDIVLSNDIKKVKINDAEFSFLIDTDKDPELYHEHAEQPIVEVKTKFQKKHLLFALPPLLIMLIILIVVNDQSASNSAVLFNNERDLMRADLNNFYSTDIIIKTNLIANIEKVLESAGVSYVRADLQDENRKLNLYLYVFDTGEQDLALLFEQQGINWLDNVIIKALDPKNMYQDFNIIAEKYNLAKKNIFERNLVHELIELYLTNNNLTFNSIQRDLAVFYNKWGKNYIEFNVNLKETKEMPIDFMILDNNNKFIKSGQGYYFN